MECVIEMSVCYSDELLHPTTVEETFRGCQNSSSVM